MPIKDPLVALVITVAGYAAIVLLVALIGEIADAYGKAKRDRWRELHDIARREIERVMTEESEETC